MLPTYLVCAAPAALYLLWAAYKHYTDKKKESMEAEDQDRDGQAAGYQLPVLRTRPLKPAVDLEIYTYM